MPPKKGGKNAQVEEVADVNVPPENDDDRAILITVSGSLAPRPSTAIDGGDDATTVASQAFAPALYMPSVALNFPETDAAVSAVAGLPEGFVARPEAFATGERDFTATLYSRRLTLGPNVVAQLLGGQWRFVASCLPDPPKDAPPAQATTAKGGKAGGKAAAKSGGKDKDAPGTARSERPDADAITLLNKPFVLSDLFLQKTKLEFVFEGITAINGFDRLVLTISTNAPLLSAANSIKYPACVVHVQKVSQLPPKGAIDPQRHIQTVSGSLSATAAAQRELTGITKQYHGVMVKATWRAGTKVDLMTERVPHDSTVSFDRTFVIFLHLLPKLAVLQKLFEDSLKFEIHDRDPKDDDQAEAVPHGTASVSLREAVSGMTRFVDNTQVIPSRVMGATAALPDYYSFGTQLHTKVSFTAPLPFITFVAPPRPLTAGGDATGSDASPTGATESVAALNVDEGAVSEPCVKILSRVALVMPYRSEMTSRIIAAVMGVLVDQPRPNASCDVAEVPVKPAAAAPAPDEKAAASGKKGGKSKDKDAVEQPDDSASAAVLAAEHPAGGKREQLLVSVADNVSGFEIMDGSNRIVVIEGPLPFTSKVAAVASSISGGDETVRILFNFELPFIKRRYHVWVPLVRAIVPPSVLAEQQAAAAADLAATSPDAGGKASRGGPKGGPKPPASSSKSSRPAVPPIASASSPTAAGAPGSLEEAPEEDDDDAAELDAGGVGGRIRRIRLKQTLKQMYENKANYIRRSLNGDALTCIHRLIRLMTSPTIVHALDHDLFPTANEIIALERIAGDCLGVYDVCAAEDFYNFGDQDVSHLVAEAERQQAEHLAERSRPPAHQVDLTDLDHPESMGKVTSFVAVPTTPDEVARLPSLHKSVRRYQHTAYMTESETHRPVRCAFSVSPPTQLLRFLVTGQVVPDGSGHGVLFVMSCISLAKKGTDSRNPAFVAKKKAEERRLPASSYYQQRRQDREEYRRTHAHPGAWDRQYRDDSSDDEDGFADAPPQRDDLSGHAEVKRDAEPHHIGLNRTRLHEQSSTAAKRKLEEARALDEQYARARETHNTMVQKELEEIDRIERLRPHDGRPSFTTLNQRTAVEDAKPKMAPSPARVDDLHQTWEPPQPSMFQQSGPPSKPMKFDGAKNVTATRFESVFAENASERRAREEEDRRREREDWEGKVVVDDVKFRVATKQPKGPPHALDKHRTMLDGEPKKASLRKVRMVPAPVSIREVEKLVPNERVDPKSTKHPERRQFYYAKRVDEKLAKIEPVSESEMQGPLWY